MTSTNIRGQLGGASGKKRKTAEIKEFPQLKELVETGDGLRQMQFDQLLKVINKNMRLWDTILVAGTRVGEDTLRAKAEIKNATYYPRKGVWMAQTQSNSRGNWHPNIPPCGPETSRWESIYYIPREKSFIKVKTAQVYTHEAGAVRSSWTTTTYYGAEKASRDEVFPLVDVKGMAERIEETLGK